MLHYRASAGEARLLQAELNHARPEFGRADPGGPARPAPSCRRSSSRRCRRSAGSTRWSTTRRRSSRRRSARSREAHWDDLIGTNLQVPLFLAQAAAPALRKAQGAIVNLSDIHAERPLKNYVVYSIAKAGLVGPHALARARTGARRARQRRRARARSCGPTTNRSTSCRGSGSSRTRRCEREGTPDDIAARRALPARGRALHHRRDDQRRRRPATWRSESDGRWRLASRRSADTFAASCLEVRIDDAVRHQRDARALEIIERRPERAFRVGDHARLARRAAACPRTADGRAARRTSAR